MLERLGDFGQNSDFDDECACKNMAANLNISVTIKKLESLMKESRNSTKMAESIKAFSPPLNVVVVLLDD